MLARWIRCAVPGAVMVLDACAGVSAQPIQPTPTQAALPLIFDDPGTAGHWQDKWFKDGQGEVRYTTDGLVYDATSGETVLWARPIVGGDVRVEYDYTHLDSSPKPYVVIIFIQAQGAGSRPADISTWPRPVASYPIYHDEMDNYSITYDNSGGNVRARQNAGFTGLEQYHYVDLFERNQTYHITIEKSGRDLAMTVDPVGSGAPRRFAFTASGSPVIDHGRIGLRQMADRISRYRNFKIWATEYEGGGGKVADPGASGERGD